MHLYKEKKKEEKKKNPTLSFSLYTVHELEFTFRKTQGETHIVGPITDFMRQQNVRYVKAFTAVLYQIGMTIMLCI